MSAAPPGSTSVDAAFLRATRHTHGMVSATPQTWLAGIRHLLALHDLDLQREHGDLGEDAYRVRLELAQRQVSDEVWCAAAALAQLGHQVIERRDQHYKRPAPRQESQS